MKHTSMRKMLFALAVVAGSFGFGGRDVSAETSAACRQAGGTCFPSKATADSKYGDSILMAGVECGTGQGDCYTKNIGTTSCTGTSSCMDSASCASKGGTSTGACTNAWVCCSMTGNSSGPGTGANTGNNAGPGTSTGGGNNAGPGTSSDGSQSTTFANPLKYNTVQDVLGSLLDALQGIIVTLSIIFIIIGAILYITSAGDSKKTESAKHAITAAMIGLALGIAAPSFLKEISTILKWDSTPSNVSRSLSLTEIALRVLDFLLGITGIISIIMLIIGALMYLSSAGDEDRLDKGKEIVTYSIIGITVALAAMVIVRQIATFF